MNKTLLYLLVSIIMATILVGCGGNNDTQETEQDDQSESTEESEGTRTVEHDLGEVEVPANPEKIVSMYYVGHLLALDKKPLGTLPTELDNPFIQDQIEGIENIGDPVSIESVIELDPDLIIASDEQSYEQLKKVAPTVLIEYGSHHVIEEMEMLGNILGKEQAASDWITQFEEKGEQAKEQLSGVVGEDETVSIIEIWANNIYVYGNKWGRGGYNLYNVLEFTPPEMVEENLIDDQPFLEVSLETLPDVAGDHIFLSVYGADGGSERAEEIRNSAVWQSLDAVKNNNVYEIDIDEFFYFDPISLEDQLDIQVDLMLSDN
ncbi:ABC transporter substrate-binding protein [Aquibacillus saliphilus]|uniref:ABC transporter substrate-binding protein n=1 Tax=Aquibacillus saliphilus TaxID=1909422 RepID=UPI001CF07015|nr:ABC transporter substrate-binding protein [Aquibacillus saliphilus]